MKLTETADFTGTAKTKYGLCFGYFTLIHFRPGQFQWRRENQNKRAGMVRVLIVDENYDSAESTAVRLKTSGHESRIAMTYPDALSIGAAFNPEIVVVNIDMDGIDIKQLKEQPWAQGACLIAINSSEAKLDGPEVGLASTLPLRDEAQALLALL